MADSRGEYEDNIMVAAPAAAVFGFVADVRNLPKYLPTTKSAEKQGAEHVRVSGEARGNRYDADGYLRADTRAMRLEWGSDEGDYSGWMHVEPDQDQSRVTVHISMRRQPGPEGQGPRPEDVREGIRRGLESIRNQVMGVGGKAEPAAAT